MCVRVGLVFGRLASRLGGWTWCFVVRGRRRRWRGGVAPFVVSVGMLLCIAAYARPAREHDSLIFMYFVPILARFVFCLCDRVRR